MHAKIDVNGEDTHPLFQQLKTGAPGLLGSKRIKWNFTKFLVGKDGTILARFGPRTNPYRRSASDTNPPSAMINAPSQINTTRGW